MPCSALFLPPEEMCGFAAALSPACLDPRRVFGLRQCGCATDRWLHGFALIRPSGPFSHAREKGLVCWVIDGSLWLPAWLGWVARDYC